jgi:hypothetical protein
MLKTCKFILAIVIVSLSIYGLVTSNFKLLPYSTLLLGFLMLVLGLEERQKGKQGLWYVSILISLFSFFASIQSFY